MSACVSAERLQVHSYGQIECMCSIFLTVVTAATLCSEHKLTSACCTIRVINSPSLRQPSMHYVRTSTSASLINIQSDILLFVPHTPISLHSSLPPYLFLMTAPPDCLQGKKKKKKKTNRCAVSHPFTPPDFLYSLLGFSLFHSTSPSLCHSLTVFFWSISFHAHPSHSCLLDLFSPF